MKLGDAATEEGIAGGAGLPLGEGGMTELGDTATEDGKTGGAEPDGVGNATEDGGEDAEGLEAPLV